ncbi:hypothetical protein PIB30_018445 [Stylosanthes scabra]|uniref:Phytosulfokine n=1 Tax=Stylosanthes scabra TaxID=79078 RepID=A0ABU6U792_9FABA|nr:hypothetical protein [Stylosanthes scabra]
MKSYNTVFGSWHSGKINRIKMNSCSKVSATLCMATLFFFFFLINFTYASRPVPVASSPLISTQTQPPSVVEESFDLEEYCEGVANKDECLMRRTLEAHLDYIYTQKANP